MNVRPFMRDQNGQVLLFACFLLIAIMVATLTVINVGALVQGKMRVQAAADVAAKSAATWKARTLNQVSALNCGIIGCLALEVMTTSSTPNSNALKNVFAAQAYGLYLLSQEICGKVPWQATMDAYRTAYLTASGGTGPAAMPQKNSVSFPREPFGGLVFSRENEFPLAFGLVVEHAEALYENNMAWDRLLKKNYNMVVHPEWFFGRRGTLTYEQEHTFFHSIKPYCLSAPLKEWQVQTSLKAIAWRRKGMRLYGPLLGKTKVPPLVCFAQANVTCEENAGELSLFVPKWRAYLEECAITPEQMEYGARVAGLDFWQGKGDISRELVNH